MTFREYGSYDAVGLSGLVRKKEVSAGELLDEAIARTATVDPKLNAVVVKHYDYAKGQIKNGLPDGPFTGVVMALGAGFYEEIAFRVLFFGLGAKLLVWLFVR